MSLLNLVELRITLQVYGVMIPRAGLRRRRERPDEVELVVADGWVGSFSLEDDVPAKIRRLNQESWQDAWVGEVKRQLLARLPIEVEPPLRIPPLSPSGKERPREETTQDLVRAFSPEFEAFRRVSEVLYVAAIPCFIVPIPPQAGWLGGGCVVSVPRLLQARIRLRRAGFLQDRESSSALYDPASGQRIELMERSCDPSNRVHLEP
jgi:hypothetical protein